MPMLQSITYLGQNNKVHHRKANNTRQETFPNKLTNKPDSVSLMNNQLCKPINRDLN